MTIFRNTAALCATGAALALCLTTAHATEVKISGTSTHVTVSTESQKLSNGNTLMHVHDKAMVETRDPKSPLANTWRDCFGTLIQDEKGNFIDGAGFCETFDKDNDGYWSTWFFTPAGARWDAFHGRGKFEGITGTGMATFVALFPDRYIAGLEGTLTMK